MTCRGKQGQAVSRPFLKPHLKGIIRHRFVRFGTVGLSGTVVNLVVLYVNQNYVLTGIFPAERRLQFSLSIAIFIATLNNYLWNRWWTWGDRKRAAGSGFFIQMAQYYLACGIAIFLQYLITILLARLVHYLLANVISIVLAAVFVYILNDFWTFASRPRRT
ncbi:MAG TPA: GtrA family protein [Deltaproteobacteria bacterium]|nr:GtrA family protein [Deltaproteobacteria bacterium]